MKSNRNKSLVKTKPIIVGFTSNGEAIIITAQTRGLLDSAYNKALSDLYSEFKIPKKAKPFFQLTKDEQELIKSSGIENETNTFVTMIDTEHKDYIENKTKLENLSIVLSYVSYLKMDAEEIELEDGRKINHYEDFELNPSISLLDLAKWFIDKEKGLGLTDNDIVEYFQEEIKRLKKGMETLGENLLKAENSKSENLYEKVLADLNETREN